MYTAAQIPIGRSDFADIRRNQYCYVDKSGLIPDLLRTEGTQVTLITRPRRFGKTLNMSMLAEFFDIRKNSAPLFDGLEVTENQALCEHWMNRCPVLFLSFKAIDGLNFAEAREMFAAVIAGLYKEHYALMESERLTDIDKVYFHRIAAQDASWGALKNSLTELTRMLSLHYGQPVILLLDEYDVPLAKAHEKGYYEEMLSWMRGMMQVIKDNSSLRFAVITGCLRIAKESFFTGTNNFVSDTITDSRLNEYFGFTPPEVETLLRDTALEEHRDEIREWYDGYTFGNSSIYCPWDVMNHLRNLLIDPGTKPESYWKNSSDNAIVRSFIDLAGDEVRSKLETLLSGGTIEQSLSQDLTYDYLHSSVDNLWNVLYQTGYLTLASGKSGNFALKIPNAEIREIFQTTIALWFNENARRADRSPLFAALWRGDVKAASELISSLLRGTISYHDYREDFYHAFLAGIFSGAGYEVESNREHGEGRSDMIIRDAAGDRAALFEVKCAASAEAMEAACKAAVAQIENRQYAQDLTADYGQVLCYGVAFYKKRCLLVLRGG